MLSEIYILPNSIYATFNQCCPTICNVSRVTENRIATSLFSLLQLTFALQNNTNSLIAAKI